MLVAFPSRAAAQHALDILLGRVVPSPRLETRAAVDAVWSALDRFDRMGA